MTTHDQARPHPDAAKRLERTPTIHPGHTFATITDKISTIVLTKKTPKGWIIGFAIAFLMLMMLLNAIGYLLLKGIGIWGNNNPVGWAFDIINFVWWIGIGHAGTLISAILLLLRQSWRTSINRFAEAMTLFAVACAGLFPALHVGRPWFAYWLFPYPNSMALWPQFRSPLMWDVFAVSTYATVSLLFWYVGPGPRPRDAARPHEAPRAQDRLRHLLARLARVGAALVPLRDRVPAAGRARDASRPLGPHDRVVRLRDLGHPRMALDVLSRRTSSRGRSSPGSRWC